MEFLIAMFFVDWGDIGAFQSEDVKLGKREIVGVGWIGNGLMAFSFPQSLICL